MEMDFKHQNFNDVMEQTIKELSSRRASLLLHACCAPCSTSCVERLADFFDVTVYFYNPNIHPENEYQKRLEEIVKFLTAFNKKTSHNVKFLEDVYARSYYDEAIKISENPELAKEREKGERCYRCYEFRLKKAFQTAVKNDFDFFATTLTLSPYKDSEKVNRIGSILDDFSVKNSFRTRYLYTDFKKKNGYLRSIKMSEEYGIYRQSYCGCSYGLENQLNIQ